MIKDYSTGVILLDKASGASSHYVLQQVKRHFNLNKIGHTGTLDPLATGLLPLCLGEATKFSGELLNSDKEYIAEIQLGLETDTKDITGLVISNNTPSQQFSETDINTILISHFLGKIKQIPPIYSALKHQGQPLYKYARSGKTDIVKPARDVHIYELELLSYNFPEQKLTIRAAVSKGTYIRVLADDISQKLCNCSGSITNLRRTKSGIFDISQALTMEKILTTTDISAILQPITVLLPDTIQYNLSPAELAKVICGDNITIEAEQLKIYQDKNNIALFFNNTFIGLAFCKESRIYSKRLVSDNFLNMNNLR